MRYPRDRHTLDRRAQGVGAGYDGSAGQHEREVMLDDRPNVAEALTPECSEVLIIIIIIICKREVPEGAPEGSG